MKSGAIISPCGRFRYHLHRQWNASGKTLLFVMLNPSTADADVDDKTIRRCIRFGERNGFAGIEVVNLFAYRATQPRDLQRAGWPVGPDNDDWIRSAAEQALGRGGAVCLAWGAEAAKLERPQIVLPMLRRIGVKPVCLGVTRRGHPRHPLYLASDTPLVPFTVEAI
jgi:hypothetical protein